MAVRTSQLPIVKNAPPGVQRCIGCGLFKTEDNYAPSHRMTGRNWNGASKCRPCFNAAARIRMLNPAKRAVVNERGRHYSRRKKYGLSESEFLAKVESQQGACAICRVDSPGGTGTWHVDHDHASGRIRGLLCSSCNRGIGYLKDSVEVLESAAIYLKSWK